jgi:hypothetical protein
MALKVSAPDGVKVRHPILNCAGPMRSGIRPLGWRRCAPTLHGRFSQVYHVTSGKTTPQWLSEGKKASLRKNEDYLRRLELLQDFSFPSACQRMKITPDGQYIFATGYHPPMVRMQPGEPRMRLAQQEQPASPRSSMGPHACMHASTSMRPDPLGSQSANLRPLCAACTCAAQGVRPVPAGNEVRPPPRLGGCRFPGGSRGTDLILQLYHEDKRMEGENGGP